MELEDLFSLRQRVAVVTGGSRGLGFAIAQGFVQYGAKVYLIARDTLALERAAAELEGDTGQVDSIAAHLGEFSEIERVAQLLASRERRIDVLVNNAAAVWNAPLECFSCEGWDKVLGLNLRTPFFLIQRLLPLLREGARVAAPARIINVASTDALHVPLTDTYSYTAAKAGLVMITRMLCARLGPDGITVNAIAPGAFPTRMTEKAFERRGQEFLSRVPLGRFGTSEDVAGAAIYLASRAGAYVSGAVLPVDGGWVGAL